MTLRKLVFPLAVPPLIKIFISYWIANQINAKTSTEQDYFYEQYSKQFARNRVPEELVGTQIILMKRKDVLLHGRVVLLEFGTRKRRF